MTEIGAVIVIGCLIGGILSLVLLAYVLAITTVDGDY